MRLESCKAGSASDPVGIPVPRLIFGPNPGTVIDF